MIIKRLKNLIDRWKRIPANITKIQEAIGRIESRQIQDFGIDKIDFSEFKVYSQWGEDGIIQFILKFIPIKNKLFIEFGVEDYTESNTRFLLKNNSWSGLVLDGNKNYIDYIINDTNVYWAHNLKAQNIFITKDNINEVINSNGIPEDIGLLSIDIDGNDYWIWDSITTVKPRIVISEFNALFGPKEKVSIPYESNFVRTEKHFSNIYYGCSLAALEYLALKKGYSLVATNTAGNNAFFVRNDLVSGFKILNAADAYKGVHFREAKNEIGVLTYINIYEQRKLISDFKVVDVETNEIKRIQDLMF